MQHLSRLRTTCPVPAWEWLWTCRICYLTKSPEAGLTYSGTNAMASTNSKQRIRMLHPHQRCHWTDIPLNQLHSSSKAKAQMRQPSSRHSWKPGSINSHAEKAWEKHTGLSCWTRGRWWWWWVVRKPEFYPLKSMHWTPSKSGGSKHNPYCAEGLSLQAAEKTTRWDVVLPLSSVLPLPLRKQPTALGTALAVGTSSPQKNRAFRAFFRLLCHSFLPLEEIMGPVPRKSPSLQITPVR